MKAKRPSFVLDASVTLAWHFADEQNDYADAVANAFDKHTAMAPGLWLIEVANVVLIGERCNRKSRATPEEFLHDLRALQILIKDAEPGSRWDANIALARKTKLTTYDACYLDLALRANLPLATLDEKLAKAAGKCGVARFEPIV